MIRRISVVAVLSLNKRVLARFCLADFNLIDNVSGFTYV